VNDYLYRTAQKVTTFHRDGTLPEDGRVFVFGSNLAGIHGAGAARVAAQRYKAAYGDGKGWMKGFKSYAIPTKDYHLKTLPLDEVQRYVDEFVQLTRDDFVINSGYFVTRVGCGLAGYRDEEVAPMFKEARGCSFAEQWRPYL
jgi:hypothetical protein